MHLWSFDLDIEIIIGNRKPEIYGNTYLDFDNGMVVVSWKFQNNYVG